MKQQSFTFTAPNGDRLEVSLETITPEIAKEYLAMEVENNRKPLQRTVNMYAGDMADGQWGVTGESIKFLASGPLADGGHRLAACVLSGVPFTTFVVRGISEEAVKNLDAGRVRSVKNFFEFEQIANATDVAAAAKKYMSIALGHVALNDSSSDRLSTSKIYSAYKENEDLYQETCRMAGAIYDKNKLLSRSNIIAISVHLIVDKGHSLDTVRDFFEQVCDLRPSCSAARVLRMKLTDDRISTTKLPGKVKQVLIAKAWNAYVSGKEVKRLYYSADQDKDLEFA